VTGPLRAVADGVLVELRVTPKSAGDRLAGFYRGADGRVALAVRVGAAPDKGKANKAVIEVLSRALGLPKSSLSIVAGETDRHKTVLISGNPQRLEALIAPLMKSIEG